AVAAAMRTGSSAGAALLRQPGNMVAGLGGFPTANGDFTLGKGQPRNLPGPLNAGGGVATLTSTSTISEQPGGAVTAAMLTGSSGAEARRGGNGWRAGGRGGFGAGHGAFSRGGRQGGEVSGTRNSGRGGAAAE